MAKFFLLTAAMSGCLAVCIGAFAAHGLKAQLSTDMLAVFRTGVDYQFYHTLALLAVALLLKPLEQSTALNVSGGLFIAGIVLFSGSLYALALGGPKWLGPITPLGGICFIIAWGAMVWAAARSNF